MHGKNKTKKGQKKMNEIPNEVKILHIHKASDNHENFIEFMLLKNGKSSILKESGFIRRYGSEALKEFEK